jgi:hypothetical protein
MRREKDIINELKEKLVTDKAIITKADKGNSIVVTYLKVYHDKVLHFIADNNFTTINNNPTKTFQKEVRRAVNECQIPIKKDKKWKHVKFESFGPQYEWPSENT